MNKIRLKFLFSLIVLWFLGFFFVIQIIPEETKTKTDPGATTANLDEAIHHLEDTRRRLFADITDLKFFVRSQLNGDKKINTNDRNE
jgi:hypothetical protein